MGFSLNLYVLILFDALSRLAREAGVKYYYLSTFSSGRLLYGIFTLYGAIQTANYSERGLRLSSDALLLIDSDALLNVGLRFFLVGIAFKLSAFPGHL